MPPTIRGLRVTLRGIRDEDELRKLVEAYNDLSQRALSDHDDVFDIASKLSVFREHGMWTASKGVLLVVDAQDTRLGTISFQRTTDIECDIGYRILRTQHRRRGYMTEALALFSSHLFETLSSVERLQIRTADDNTPSRRLAERCGFAQEGVLRNAYIHRSKLCDWIVYGLLRAEWLAISATPQGAWETEVTRR